MRKIEITMIKILYPRETKKSLPAKNGSRPAADAQGEEGRQVQGRLQPEDDPPEGGGPGRWGCPSHCSRQGQRQEPWLKVNSQERALQRFFLFVNTS